MARKRLSQLTIASNPNGRPTQYQQAFNALAYRLTLLGATDKELSEAFATSEVTINAWKNKHPNFLKSIKSGKIDADATVSDSLFKRANGYSHPDVHICVSEGVPVVTPITKHYPPDTAAAIFWLKNRQKDKWRNGPDLAVNISNEVSVETGKSPEEWSQAEIEAELKRRESLPEPVRIKQIGQ